MSRLQTRLDTRRPSYSMEANEAEFEGEAEQEQLEDESCRVAGLDGGEEEIDLEGYEEYLEQLKSKAAVRPCSARLVRPMPSESPQFYMVNASNPASATYGARPVRPASARPRLNASARNDSSGRISSTTKTHSVSGGVRRKRQGEALVHARIRAVYGDVGRSTPSTTRRMPASVPTTATISSKGKVFQEAELHDEYYRLVDSMTELKSEWQEEQQKRVKAVARVRRLEEIVAMKDKKIEALLHAKSVGSDRNMGGGSSVAQREMAQRDRQFHSLTQKLRQKIAQQSQLLSSYEEAMQSLRSGVKSTNLMELEEERSQLYLELRHQQELLARERLEWEVQERKLVEFVELDAANKLQLAKLQQDNKAVVHEKHKMEQEIGFLKSQVEQLQGSLALERRKRTYDREFGENVHKHSSASPSRNMMLSQALEEMKQLMRRESAASVQREKLKSPKNAVVTPKSARGSASGTSSVGSSGGQANLSAPKTPNRSTQAPQRRPRPLSAGPTRGHRPVMAHGAAKSATESSASYTGICEAQDRKGNPEFATPVDGEASTTAQVGPTAPGEESKTSKAKRVAPAEASVTDEKASESLQLQARETTAEAAPESAIEEENDREDLSHNQRDARQNEEDADMQGIGADSSTAQVSDGSAATDEAGREQSTAEDAALTEDEVGERHRRQIADVERMLREVDDGMDHELEESDLSAEFLDVAHQHLGGIEHEGSAVSLGGSNADEDGLEQATRTAASSNASLEGLLAAAVSVNVVDAVTGQVEGETDEMPAHGAAELDEFPPPSSYEDMYPSDFQDGDASPPQGSETGEEEITDAAQTDAS